MTTRMGRRRGTGPTCTVIWWHDIPSQVLVRAGDQTLKAELPGRFRHAIDRAATGGGRAGSGSYMEGWTRSDRPCSADLETELDAEVAALEQRFPPDELERLVAAVRAARRSAAPDAADRARTTQRHADQESRSP